MGTDPRFTHTESLIRATFIHLMDESGYSNITVTQIIHEAKINRTTFYSHYEDKDDLLETMEADLLDGVLQNAKNLPAEVFLEDSQSKKSSEMVNQISVVFSYLRSNGQFLTLLLDPVKGDLSFNNQLADTLKTSWAKNHLLARLEIPEDYALAVMTGVVSSLIGEWVHREFSESPEEFATITVKILRGLSDEMVNKPDSINTNSKNLAKDN